MSAPEQNRIVAMLREAARRQHEHLSITYEYGNALVDLVCEHGDFLATAVASHDRLLAAAKRVVANAENIMNDEWKVDVGAWVALQAAIAAAEEPAP